LTGLEDLAWANWVMHEGYAVAYVAEAEIIHVHHETPRGVYNRYRREAMAFKRIFPSEHFRLWDLIRLVVVNIANDLWHAIQSRALAGNLLSVFWFRWMQFWGTYHGYRQSGPLTWQLRQTFYYPRGVGVACDGNRRSVEPIRYNNPER
jgi:rhamnosyltransferase